ncbi:MAG: hypothetical protein FRX49_08119 [Trebouxia sp. A1-2]|nr:MAG: hypothetical protein FRX49_08119 [Trebouxia sp. A1-2]
MEINPDKRQRSRQRRRVGGDLADDNLHGHVNAVEETQQVIQEAYKKQASSEADRHIGTVASEVPYTEEEGTRKGALTFPFTVAPALAEAACGDTAFLPTGLELMNLVPPTLDCQHIAGTVSHADDVGPQGLVAQLCCHLEGLDDLKRIVDRMCKLRYGWTGFAGLGVGGHAAIDGGTRGLLPSSSRVRNSILFSSSHSAYDPISSAKPCVPGDAVNGFSVAVGLLAHVHLHEAHPKAVHASDEIQQPPLGHNPTTCSPQLIGTNPLNSTNIR